MSPAAFVWANLRRRPLHTLLGLAGVTMAFTLYGLALGEAEGFRRAALLHHVTIGSQLLYGAIAVSAAGMLLILVLAAVAMAQTVRLRLYELGVLKALGFSDSRITALLMAEAAVPCLADTAVEDVPAQHLSAAASAPSAVTSADLRLVRQMIVVTRIGLLTLRQRLRGALTIAISVACVVLALMPLLSAVEGIRVGLRDSGDPNRAVLHMAASWIHPSVLPDGTVGIVAAAPGVARAADGTPLAEGESFASIGDFGQAGGEAGRLTKRNNGEPGNTTIVGAGPLWPVMTPAFRLLAGRLPRPGTRELMAGNLARRKFSGLDSGVIPYQGQSWRIVGTFTTGSWWDGYLVADAAGFKRYTNHTTDSMVLARLTSPQAFGGFARALAGRLPANIIVDREADYYAGVWHIVPNTGYVIAYILAGLIGIGTVAAIAQIMHGALEERRREIAALRALGFDVRAVAASVVLEGALLAIVGALVGAAAVWLWLDGFLFNGAVTVFRATVDLHLLLVALAWALVIALCGTLPLATRMIWQSEIHTLQNL